MLYYRATFNSRIQLLCIHKVWRSQAYFKGAIRQPWTSNRYSCCLVLDIINYILFILNILILKFKKVKWYICFVKWKNSYSCSWGIFERGIVQQTTSLDWVFLLFCSPKVCGIFVPESRKACSNCSRWWLSSASSM